MLKHYFYLLFFLVATGVLNAADGQSLVRLNEEVYLNLPIDSAGPGDTLPFTAYVFQGGAPSHLSQVLRIETYTATGHMVQACKFKITAGQCTGQLILDDTLPPGQYFVRAYTRWQCNFSRDSLLTRPLYVAISHVAGLPHSAPVLPAVRTATGGGITLITQAYNHTSSFVHVPRDSVIVYCIVAADSMLGPSTYRLEPAIYGAPLSETAFTSDGKRSREFVFKLRSQPGPFTLKLYRDDSLLTSTAISIAPPGRNWLRLSTDTLSFLPGGFNCWHIEPQNIMPGSLTVTVQDGDAVNDITDDFSFFLSHPLPATGWDTTAIPFTGDTNFLSFQGLITRPSGKPLAGEYVAYYGNHGTTGTILFYADSAGHYRLDGLDFTDTAFLRVQLNQETERAKNIRIKAIDFPAPPFAVPAHDTAFIAAAANRPLPALPAPVRDKTVELKEIVIKGETLKRMNKMYTTGFFASSPFMSFDARGNNAFDIWDFMDRTYPGWRGLVRKRRRILFYVDEREVDKDLLALYPFYRIAFVKFYNDWPLSDNPALPTAALCMYTAKDEDINVVMGAGLESVNLIGYTSAYPFHGKGRLLYFGQAPQGRVAFPTGAKSFVLTARAIGATGEPLFFSTRITTP